MMSLFGVSSTSVTTQGCASGISTFIVPIFFFGNFLFSWFNCWFFAWLESFIVFFWVHLLELLWVCLHYMHPQRFWIGESSLWLGRIFNLGFFLFHLLEFYWYAPLTGTIRGTSGEVAFPNIPSRDISYYFCVFTSVNIDMEGAGLCSAWIKSCMAWIFAYVEGILGMLNFFWGGL